MKKRVCVAAGLVVAMLLCVSCGKAAPSGPPAAGVNVDAAQPERSVSVVPPVSQDTAPAEVATEAAGEKDAQTAENTAVADPASAPETAPAPEPSPAAPTTPEGEKSETAVPLPDKVARVGDMVITGQEYARDLAMRVAALRRDGNMHVDPNDREFRAAALAEMIDARVLCWVASRAVTVSDEEVNREFDRGRRVVGSEERFQEYLKREGVDQAGLKGMIRDRLCIEAYKKRRLDETAVSDEEVKKLYDQWEPAGRFDRKERTADLLHIAIHPLGDQPADMEEARKAVEAARARIAAGEDFRKVAAEVSDDKNVAQTGGYYPEASAGNLPQYIAERMFNQPVNELSAPFEGGRAWHLLQVLSVNEPGKVSFEKARDQIRNFLLEGKRREEMSKAIEQAKFVMDIEIYKAELRPEKGPGSVPPGAGQPSAVSVAPEAAEQGENKTEDRPAPAE